MYFIVHFRLNLVRSSCTNVQQLVWIGYFGDILQFYLLCSTQLCPLQPCEIPKYLQSSGKIKKCDGSEADSELPKEVFFTEFKGLTLSQCAFSSSYLSLDELPCPQAPRPFPILSARAL